ncbi:MAG TPA: energy transducer TonB [Candidatus Dormibacteraeota bacterium]|nr:energy transducer TonB [Candidatus Dormibacteraeota bacterium]
MSRFQIAAVVGALLLHAGILLFGGLVLPRRPEGAEVRKDVALIDEADPDKTDKADKKDEEKVKTDERQDEDRPPEISVTAEPMPDTRNLANLDAEAAGPALDALSLNDLEGALNPGEGGMSFGQGFSLASGGRIGAAGGPGGPSLEEIAAVADLDQRPQAVAQNAPMYPAELRRRRVEGTVTLVFLVDTEGRVVNPTVEKSTDPGFERPALEAVRRWRFEPGTRQGHKVQFKMRVPITFRAG